MLKYLASWNEWLGRRMFVGVLAALVMGFVLSIPKSPFWNTLAVAMFAYMTFVTSLEISLGEFLRVMRKPKVAVWILFLIHIVTPLVAWGVGMVFYPDDFLVRTGLLISAGIPVAVTSIIWTSVARGNVALALVIVTLDTLVTPFLLPGFFALAVGKSVNIDYGQMLVQLLWMVTIPSLLGVAVNYFAGNRIDRFSGPVGGFTAKLALFFVIVINASAIAPEVKWDISLVKMLLVILVLVISGYLLGYLGTYVLKERHKETAKTMVYSVGMRNISFGSVLAVAYFPASVAVPVTLAMIFQQPLAAIVARLFERAEARRERQLEDRPDN